MAGPRVTDQGHQYLSPAPGVSFFIDDEGIAEKEINLWIRPKGLRDFFQGVGQILLVTIQVRTNRSLRFFKTTVDGVIHSLVLFGNHHPPIPRSVRPPLSQLFGKRLKSVRSRVLNNMFHHHALLTRHRGDATFQLLQLPKAWGNDSKFHIPNLLVGLSRFKSPAPDISYQPPATHNPPPTTNLPFLQDRPPINSCPCGG